MNNKVARLVWHELVNCSRQPGARTENLERS
jgi:hypothetical protein